MGNLCLGRREGGTQGIRRLLLWAQLVDENPVQVGAVLFQQLKDWQRFFLGAAKSADNFAAVIGIGALFEEQADQLRIIVFEGNFEGGSAIAKIIFGIHVAPGFEEQLYQIDIAVGRGSVKGGNAAEIRVQKIRALGEQAARLGNSAPVNGCMRAVSRSSALLFLTNFRALGTVTRTTAPASSTA